MMKQMIQMFLFDIKMSFKSFMGAYMLIVPFVILIVLRLFLPTVESSSLTIGVVSEGPNAVERVMIDELDTVVDILELPTVEALENKLRGVGTMEGLYWDPVEDQYVTVLERTSEDNVLFSVASRFARQMNMDENYPGIKPLTTFTTYIPDELADRTETSPVASMGGSIFIVFMIIITAFLIALAIVDDKEHGTILALRSSPVNNTDYIIGRSIFPLVATIFYTLVAMFVLGLSHVNIGMVMVMLVGSFSLTLLFGLFIGALGSNEVEAIGLGKVSSLLLMLAILGATLLPESWHWVVWWSPVYWIYDALEQIFTETLTWPNLFINLGITIGEVVVIFILLRKKIIKGLM